jgi:hypothetical protein
MRKDTRPLRVDVLRDLCENSGVRVNLKNTKSWIFDCPKCGKDERLYIRRRDGRFVCWYCRDKTAEGFSGAPEYALAPLLGKTISELEELLYGPAFKAVPRLEVKFTYSALPYREDAGEDEDQDFGQVEAPVVVPTPKGKSYPLNFQSVLTPGGAKGLAYLEGRGISSVVAARYALMYDPEARRVVFPVWSRGVLVGWQARCVGPNEWVDAHGNARKIPKILTTMEDGWRDNVLMFEHRLEGSEHAVLVEGPVDALKCDLCGGNVASMGKSVSEGQIERLRAFGVKRLYLGQDPDASKETTLLNKRYGEEFELWYMTPEGTGYEDFGAMPPECALECFRAAERVHARRLFVYFNH